MLCMGKVVGVWIEKAATILEVFTEDLLVETSRYFVVLLVCFVRKHGHGGGVGFFYVLFHKFCVGLAVLRFALIYSLLAEVAYARPNYKVWQKAFFGKFDKSVGQAHEEESLFSGGQGKKADVRSTYVA
tara:strand:- start:82 stop:468 length:387 start_codon:yes stop_codon:yes gene_type:complete